MPALIPYGTCLRCGKERSEHYKGKLDNVYLTGNLFEEDATGFLRAYHERHPGWDDGNRGLVACVNC